MAGADLDVVVADDGIGSLAAAYSLAKRGRRVAVVEPAEAGLSAHVGRAAVRRVGPLADLADASPAITRRRATVLLPEGGLSVEIASDRMSDEATTALHLRRPPIVRRLVDALRELGALLVPRPCRFVLGDGGEVVGVRDGAGTTHLARCSVLGRSEVERLTGSPGGGPRPPSSVVVGEWETGYERPGANAVHVRAGAGAEAVWLYGDPFDGEQGFARLVGTGGWASLTVAVPLEVVFRRRLSVPDLAGRLILHPEVRRLLGGIRPPTVVVAETLDGGPGSVGSVVGDGWVAAPRALPADVAPASTEIAMAEAISADVDAALSVGPVTAARLARLARETMRLRDGAPTVPLGPIDAWGDELVRRPGELAGGLQLLAERFAAAG